MKIQSMKNLFIFPICKGEIFYIYHSSSPHLLRFFLFFSCSLFVHHFINFILIGITAIIATTIKSHQYHSIPKNSIYISPFYYFIFIYYALWLKSLCALSEIDVKSQKKLPPRQLFTNSIFTILLEEKNKILPHLFYCLPHIYILAYLKPEPQWPILIQSLHILFQKYDKIYSIFFL